jgi:hypothetical protein
VVQGSEVKTKNLHKMSLEALQALENPNLKQRTKIDQLILQEYLEKEIAGSKTILRFLISIRVLPHISHHITMINVISNNTNVITIISTFLKTDKNESFVTHKIFKIIFHFLHSFLMLILGIICRSAQRRAVWIRCERC